MSQNRTMEKSDLLSEPMASAMRLLIQTAEIVTKAGGKFCSWVGTLDDEHIPTTVSNKGPGYEPMPDWPYDEMIPWFTLWEYCWTLSNLRTWAAWRKLRVLSLGGNACLLDIALMLGGHFVTLVEMRGFAVEQQIKNAELIGCKHLLRPFCGKMEDILQQMSSDVMRDVMVHDAMTSTNVLFLAGEAAQRAVAANLKDVIMPGGRAFFTFDVFNPNPKRYLDDPIKHFKWDGFSVVPEGDRFHDTGSRHHFYYPEPSLGRYTAGGLIQERV